MTAIIARAQKGDGEAFRELYRAHVSRARGVLVNLVGREELDDVTQEVFVRVWKALPAFRGEASFSTWLFRIVRNAASDRRKTLALRRSRNEPMVSADTLAAPQGDPDAKMVVAKALRALSDDLRMTVVLVDLEEFPLQEVAEILEIPLGTVKSRLHAARKALRETLTRDEKRTEATAARPAWEGGRP